MEFVRGVNLSAKIRLLKTILINSSEKVKLVIYYPIFNQVIVPCHHLPLLSNEKDALPSLVNY
jgi:hypothetical protein